MQQIFTKEFMDRNSGCYSSVKLYACSFMKLETITLSSIVKSEIRLKDKFWFVCEILATRQQNKQIAIDVAEIVLPIFEKMYPDDKRPREAVEAAKAFIAGTMDIDAILQKRKSASNAAIANYTYSAYTVAAYACQAAASAAINYEYDYACAAVDASSITRDPHIKTQMNNYLLRFVE